MVKVVADKDDPNCYTTTMNQNAVYIIEELEWDIEYLKRENRKLKEHIYLLEDYIINVSKYTGI